MLKYIRPLSATGAPLSHYPKDALDFCELVLVHVSRSFAAVIAQLPAIVRTDVLVFYLVLRALDTIEDDTTAFSSHAVKIQHLNDFARNALRDPTWRMQNVGQGYEQKLLEEFPQCQAVFAALPKPSQDIIADITQRMSDGMAEFVSKDLGQGTLNVEEYNRYCHFVAGLVGEGLSRLFAATGLEDASLSNEVRLSDQMGLFLQKTNIIRDYLEDYVDKRAFWPQSVWRSYALTSELGYFCNQEDAQVRLMSLFCLNELVTDALELVPDCLEYLSKLQCLEVFRFCAIPQVMAIATLDKCYGNNQVFTGVVKIRKGLSCSLILNCNSLAQVHEIFYTFAKTIHYKALKQGEMDPSYTRTLAICDRIMELTYSQTAWQMRRRKMPLFVGVAAAVGASRVLERGVSTRQSVGWGVAAGLLTYGCMKYFAPPLSKPLIKQSNV
jgi:farnesyl-diphosphate farnesyltransferase